MIKPTHHPDNEGFVDLVEYAESEDIETMKAESILRRIIERFKSE